MPALLKQILQWLCPHRFWPHCCIHGQDYQICLNCGAVYGYEVDKMRRTKAVGFLYGCDEQAAIVFRSALGRI